ncbi:hypothetical protein AM588_10007056 [Phytophthora nicotianae]|uniref:Uncharacterized protein n=1 Tax=Phytophthora nicotianae TaxID=4792 RepID=A0A0W8DN98_PHYNI|nr:hypothetical protein AM588_10007056 [Phytophthora nicotianae]
MKFSTLAVTTFVAVTGVASANDYQPALRALAVAEPAAVDEHNAQLAVANPPADAAGKEHANANANVDADDKKKKEWWGGGFGWGGPWGGCGGWVVGDGKPPVS